MSLKVAVKKKYLLSSATQGSLCRRGKRTKKSSSSLTRCATDQLGFSLDYVCVSPICTTLPSVSKLFLKVWNFHRVSHQTRFYPMRLKVAVSCFSFLRSDSASPFFFASLSHAGKKDIYFQSGKRRPIVQLGKTDEKVFVSVDFNFASAATQDAMRNRSLAGPTPFRLSFFSHQTKEERATKKINTTQCATGGLRDRHPSTYVFFPHQETHANNQKKQSRITRKGTKTRFLRFLRSIRISCF